MNKFMECFLLSGLIAASAVSAQERMIRGHYSLVRTMQAKTLVTKIDLDAVRKHHLASYDVQRTTEDKGGEKHMVLYDKDAKQKIEVRTRLFPSALDTENGVLDLLNSQSVIFANGTPSGRAIGDNVWHFTMKETGATTIVLMRRNVVVSVFAQDAAVADTMAEELDADILAGINGIDVKDVQ